MSGYWIVGLSVIGIAIVFLLLLRMLGANAADALEADLRRNGDGLPRPSSLFDIDDGPGNKPEDDTAPAYLSPPEIEPPKRAARGRTRR
jgi:hypothetical protein